LLRETNGKEKTENSKPVFKLELDILMVQRCLAPPKQISKNAADGGFLPCLQSGQQPPACWDTWLPMSH